MDNKDFDTIWKHKSSGKLFRMITSEAEDKGETRYIVLQEIDPPHKYLVEAAYGLKFYEKQDYDLFEHKWGIRWVDVTSKGIGSIIHVTQEDNYEKWDEMSPEAQQTYNERGYQILRFLKALGVLKPDPFERNEERLNNNASESAS